MGLGKQLINGLYALGYFGIGTITLAAQQPLRSATNGHPTYQAPAQITAAPVLIDHFAQKSQQWLNQWGEAEIALQGSRSDRLQGSVGVLLPLQQSSQQLLFTQGGWQRDPEGTLLSLGIGQRWFYSAPSYWGYNLFYDYRRHGQHQRLGLGVEQRHSSLSWNLNGYLPLSPRRLVANRADWVRPARGLDLRLQYQPPQQPHWQVNLTTERYFGTIDSARDHTLQRNPTAVTLGVAYTPLPLVTAGYGFKVGSGRQRTHQLQLTLHYHLGVPLAHQLDPQQVAAAHSLDRNRLALVQRNFRMVLQQQPNDEIQLALQPGRICQPVGSPPVTIALQLHSPRPLEEWQLEWRGDLLQHTAHPTINAAKNQASLILPHHPGTYRLQLVARNARGVVAYSNELWVVAEAANSSEPIPLPATPGLMEQTPGDTTPEGEQAPKADNRTLSSASMETPLTETTHLPSLTPGVGGGEHGSVQGSESEKGDSDHSETPKRKVPPSPRDNLNDTDNLNDLPAHTEDRQEQRSELIPLPADSGLMEQTPGDTTSDGEKPPKADNRTLPSASTETPAVSVDTPSPKRSCSTDTENRRSLPFAEDTPPTKTPGSSASTPSARVVAGGNHLVTPGNDHSDQNSGLNMPIQNTPKIESSSDSEKNDSDHLENANNQPPANDADQSASKIKLNEEITPVVSVDTLSLRTTETKNRRTLSFSENIPSTQTTGSKSSTPGVDKLRDESEDSRDLLEDHNDDSPTQNAKLSTSTQGASEIENKIVDIQETDIITTVISRNPLQEQEATSINNRKVKSLEKSPYRQIVTVFGQQDNPLHTSSSIPENSLLTNDNQSEQTKFKIIRQKIEDNKLEYDRCLTLKNTDEDMDGLKKLQYLSDLYHPSEQDGKESDEILERKKLEIKIRDKKLESNASVFQKIFSKSGISIFRET